MTDIEQALEDFKRSCAAWNNPEYIQAKKSYDIIVDALERMVNPFKRDELEAFETRLDQTPKVLPELKKVMQKPPVWEDDELYERSKGLTPSHRLALGMLINQE